MALISLSEWLDRFGDAPEKQLSSDDLDALRIDVHEGPSTSPEHRPERDARACWQGRLRQIWQRARWRLRRVTSGQS